MVHPVPIEADRRAEVRGDVADSLECAGPMDGHGLMSRKARRLHEATSCMGDAAASRPI